MITNSDIRWITLDATGTLIDPHPSVGHVYSTVMARHGIDVHHGELQNRFIEVFRSMTKTPRGEVSVEGEFRFWKELVLNVMAPWINEGQHEALFNEAYNVFAETDSWKAMPGAAPLLAELKGRGYKLALLSNADARVRTIMREMGLAAHMEHIFLSCELGYEKPDRRLFAKVEELLGCSGKNILHVGDSKRNDGTGPREAGWNALVIGDELEELKSLRNALP